VQPNRLREFGSKEGSMIWTILLLVGITAVASFAWAQALSNQEARRTKRAGVIPVCRELPRNINTATAWRRR
jgi:hypothetical protein